MNPVEYLLTLQAHHPCLYIMGHSIPSLCFCIDYFLQMQCLGSEISTKLQKMEHKCCLHSVDFMLWKWQNTTTPWLSYDVRHLVSPVPQKFLTMFAGKKFAVTAAALWTAPLDIWAAEWISAKVLPPASFDCWAVVTHQLPHFTGCWVCQHVLGRRIHHLVLQQFLDSKLAGWKLK